MGLPTGVFSETYEQDKAILRTRLHWVLLFGALGLLGIVPLFASSFLLMTLILGSIYVIAALGLNILTGYCGQISLGHSAFMAVGAYTSGILAFHLGFPFWATLPIGVLGAGLVGLLFGLPALRVKGLYLALITLAAQVVILYVIKHGGDITRAATGIGIPLNPVRLGSIVFDSDFKFYYLMLGFTVLAIFLAHNIARSALGRAFIAIRDNDLAAEVMGIDLFRYKSLAFFIGCAFAGLAGALHGFWLGVILPEYYTLIESVWYLGMIIIGGMGSTVGSVTGALFVAFLTQYSTYFFSGLASTYPAVAGIVIPIKLVLFGLIIILVLIFEPRGIAHGWQLFKAYYRLWPFPH